MYQGAMFRNDPKQWFSNLGSQLMSYAQKGFNDPRVQGSMQALGGLVETGIGAGMTLGSGGIGSAAGWPLMAHGCDQFITGARTALSGTHGYTATSQLLHKTGMSYRTAGCIDNGVSLFGSIGGMAAMQSSRVAANTWRLPSFGEMSAQNNFKPFNQRNFRSNLIESTGVPPGKNAQAHHVFPQNFKEILLKKGLTFMILNMEHGGTQKIIYPMLASITSIGITSLDMKILRQLKQKF